MLIKKVIHLIVILAFFLFAFLYGLGVGHFKWEPFGLLHSIKSQFTEKASKQEPYQGERGLLKFAFSDPLINGEKIYQPIKELSDIKLANQHVFMFVDGFETAYQKLVVKSTEQLTLDSGATQVIRVRFQYQGRNYDAYAYGELPRQCNSNQTGILIIPGSGFNQSSDIYQRNRTNYHYGIMNAIEIAGGKVFTFIKPNEDILAWHDGSKKLNTAFFVNYHLNLGGSYSGSYIVQSMAITKYLKNCYKQTIVAGLSQGGAAALLNAIQTQPDLAIISSGYSILNYQIEWSGANQIIGIPFWGAIADPSNFVKHIQNSSTKFLFTYGLSENGIYGIEANERLTCRLVEHLENVRCEIHEGGHIFPVAQVQNFLKQSLGFH